MTAERGRTGTEGGQAMQPKDEHETREEPAGGPDRQQQTGSSENQPAQEWGERQDTGQAIHRGGKEDGDVPGGTPRQS